MMLRLRRSIASMTILCLALAITGFLPDTSYASEWPSQNITVIVPSNPGGGLDLVARVTAPFIKKYLPRPVNVIVKNVPGAGTRLGTREIVKSKPDGLTIGIFDPLVSSVMEIGAKLEWMDNRKVSWLAMLDNLPAMVLAGPKTGYKHPKDMQGKNVRFIGHSDGTIFRSIIFARSIGAHPTFLRYSGTGEGVLASLRGDLDALLLSWSSGLRVVKANEGKMVALFVSPQVPGLHIPSAKDLGIVLDEVVMYHTHMLAGPPGLSPEARPVWDATLTKVLKDPEYGAKMETLGYPISSLVGKAKLDTWIASLMKMMEKHKDIIDGLPLI